tara:strand:- start:24 stop:419 length:396 start_codon:yes stop_codon:yes gene_type:complete
VGFKSPVTAKRVAAYVLEDQVRTAVEYLGEHVFISDWFNTLSERDQGAIFEAADSLARPFIERMGKIAAPISEDPDLVSHVPHWSERGWRETPNPVDPPGRPLIEVFADDDEWCEICEGEWCECEEDAEEY